MHFLKGIIIWTKHKKTNSFQQKGQMKECVVSLHGQNYLCWSLNADIGSTSVLSLPSSLSLLPALQPVGEGRIPAGWGLSPGRTGALSPEGRSHSLTDSLASSDQAASKGERERGREIGYNHSADVNSRRNWCSCHWSFALAQGCIRSCSLSETVKQRQQFKH